MISITLVPTQHVPYVWDDVASMLVKAVVRSGGRFSIDDLYHELLDGTQSLWLALDGDKIIGTATIKVNRYKTGLVTLSYEYLGGEDVRRWMHQAHEVMLRYAKEYGCHKIEIVGRSGWKPLLEQLGGRQTNVQYEFELKD